MRNCQHCGIVFKPETEEQIYCKLLCSNLFLKKKEQNKKVFVRGRRSRKAKIYLITTKK